MLNLAPLSPSLVPGPGSLQRICKEEQVLKQSYREAWLLHDQRTMSLHLSTTMQQLSSYPGSTSFCSKPLYPSGELPGKPWEWDFRSGCCGDLSASRCGAGGQMPPQSRAGNGASPYKGMYSMQGTCSLHQPVQ